MPSDQFVTTDPRTNQPLKTYSYASKHEILKNLNDCAHSQAEWSRVPLNDRKSKVLALTKVLREARDECARSMALEMGKPLAAGRAEIDKCIQLCEVSVAQVDSWVSLIEEQSLHARNGAHPGYSVAWSASGLSLGIMPWNFPFWQVFRMAIPALLGGNGVVMKPAEPTAGTGILLESLFAKAFPPNLFKTLIFSHDELETVVSFRKISSVTFTGSTMAGSKIAEVCGRYLKKCVLELGGNDPYVIAPSADLKRAAEVCARARLVNSGQSCVAAKRFYVHETVLPQFKKLLIEEIEKFSLGNPLEDHQDDKIHLGPLCGLKYRDILLRQKELLEKSGFRSVFSLPGIEEGAFVAPEVFIGEGPGPVDEEIFGPFFQLMTYRDFDHVIEWCNSSRYGLGAGLFSSNEEELRRFSAEIEAGFIALNDHVRSDPRYPFGGVKDSGFGREMGVFGFLELINIKTLLKK